MLCSLQKVVAVEPTMKAPVCCRERDWIDAENMQLVSDSMPVLLGARCPKAWKQVRSCAARASWFLFHAILIVRNHKASHSRPGRLDSVQPAAEVTNQIWTSLCDKVSRGPWVAFGFPQTPQRLASERQPPPPATAASNIYKHKQSEEQKMAATHGAN